MYWSRICAGLRSSAKSISHAPFETHSANPRKIVIRRRVELAAQYMLLTEAPLSDIALRCGFTDQPHLCKHFRQTTGYTPAAWRRAHRKEDECDENCSLIQFRAYPDSLDRHIGSRIV